MASNSNWGMTPQQSIERECAIRGRPEVIEGCRELIRGGAVDPGLLLALGGPGARKFLDGRGHEDTYWPRVWGTRGLLWAWDSSAVDEIRLALVDDSWRVREMALKVIAGHQLGDLLADVAQSRSDPVSRVREEADRALALLTAAGS